MNRPSSARRNLADHEVLDIRHRRAARETLATIARDYQLSESHISRICSRQYYAHVLELPADEAEAQRAAMLDAMREEGPDAA